MVTTLDYRDGRYYLDGEPYFVVASDYMYFRDRRDHWRDRLTKLKDAGVRVITTYIPWRHHLRVDGGRRTYDFTGETKDSRDVVSFLDAVESLGFYMVIKPGPFVHSELNIGGLPDIASPSFNPEVPPARRHHGGPAVWSYDASQLPAPFDDRFDALVAEWFQEVRRVIEPFALRGGPLLGIQLVDETIYCSSNDPPWNLGYEESGLRYYRHLLREDYGDIATYNHLHGTAHSSWENVSGPELPRSAEGAAGRLTRREDVLQYVDWAKYQWRYRRDLYERYKTYLGFDTTYLTNYAGITPPIEENVPDLQEDAVEVIPGDFQKLYPEWWFAMNRVDRDSDLHEYGLISWLGVAAYDRDVFDRYVNTACRARGINMEENWGFAKLYDERSKHPMIPFFQTLVTVAAGATGYDIFVGVSSDYWDDSLDRITKRQHPTFPSDAPIDEHGRLRPLYGTAKMLNQWFLDHGGALLRCEIERDCGYLLYAPYAAVSSWVPDERYWGVEGAEVPRCGHQGVEEFSRSCQEAGYSIGFFELDVASEGQMGSCKALALHSGFFMDEAEQAKLVAYIEDGGQLFLSGELPTVDLHWRPCTRLKDVVEAAASRGDSRVVHRGENFFVDGRFPAKLAEARIEPGLRASPDMRAFVHRHPETDERFVFFFNFDLDGTHDKFVEVDGMRLELRVGSKTCGVVRLRQGRIVAHLVKGTNEVEGITDTVRLRIGEQVIEGRGDFSSSGA